MGGAGAPQVTVFAAVGGHPFFARLAEGFYARVAHDPALRALYPEQDLAPAAERLRLFLEQYWGGPTTYSDARGHPRLRMRHAGFRIDGAAAERWLDHMRGALDAEQLPPGLHDQLAEYFERAAPAMVNTA